MFLQVPIHLDSHCFLMFVCQGAVHQSKVLCFGVTTAPQVFSKVTAPVSVILLQSGCLHPPVSGQLASSCSASSIGVTVMGQILNLCEELGILINLKKTIPVPSQQLTYLGMVTKART